MDENAWRAKHAALNPRPCVFENALLARCAQCTLAAHRAIAERESVLCSDEARRARCAAFAERLRAAAAFALRAPNPALALSHQQNLRLSCGGLQGLNRLLDPVRELPSVERLLAEAEARWQDLDALPYEEVVRAVASWRSSRRSRSR